MLQITTKIFLRIFLLFFLFTGEISAQQYLFKYYSLEHGLAQSQVLSLCQDSKGYLWIGTYGGGLNRFDGISFTLFSLSDGLSTNTIRVVFEDSKKNIWIGFTDGTLCKYDGKGFKSITKNRLSILSIREDIKGNLWIGTDKEGLYELRDSILVRDKRYDFLKDETIDGIYCDPSGKLFLATKNRGLVVITENSHYIISEKDGLPSVNAIQIVKDKFNRYWIGTDKGLCSYDGKTVTSYPEFSGKDDVVTDILIDRHNTLWATTFGNGIIKYSSDKFTRFTEADGLKGNYYNCMVEDNMGYICFGSDGDGICRFEGERFRYYNTMTGLPGNTIMSLYQDNEGSYWFGTYGKGVCRIAENKKEIFTKKEGLCSDIIYSIIGDSTGAIWFGSKNGGITKFFEGKFKSYTEKDGLPSDEATSITIDHNGLLWIGTRHHGACLFTGKSFIKFGSSDGLASINITGIFVDKKNNIWLGSQEGIINKIEQVKNIKGLKDDDIKSCFKISSYTTEKLNSSIYTFAEDRLGRIWMGSQENGVFSYDGQTFKNYNTQDGLTSDFIYSLIIDNSDNIWLGTSKGLNKISLSNNLEKISIRYYGIKEGFTGIENNSHAVIKDKEGKLLFGTVNGVMVYNPKADTENKVTPKTNISDILLFFQKPDWNKFSSGISAETSLPLNLKLPHNKNYLTFKFIGIDLSNPTSVKYKWKLEGFDEDWTPITPQNEVTYSNLPPGEYTFLVKSFNSNGYGDDQAATFRFTIIPPFWKTLWFRVSIGVAVLLLIYLFFKQKEIRNRRYTRKLEKLVSERTEEIVHQKGEIEEKNSELEDINKKLEKLSIVAKETDNAVLIMDADGRIEWMNEGFLSMHEYTHQDLDWLKKTSVSEISNYPEINEVLNLCLASKQSVVYEAPTTTRSGKKIWTHTTLTPIIDDNYKVIKLVAIDSDISKVIEAEEKLKTEKEKTENLLLNILPSEIAEELKEKGEATPRYYKSATIAFTDFKGFTLLCSKISPHELVSQLHQFFAKFDDITSKYTLEKIKTIGDSYMFAGGLPSETKTHPIEVILAALEIQNFMRQIQIQNRSDIWQLRIGIHTGEVIAGVVGKKKFAYDIWGDTVNVASRMESAGIPGGVNVSEETHNLIKEYFICHNRGEIDVKHKDKINMFLVEAIKPEYSVDGKGIIPTPEFLTEIAAKRQEDV